MAGDSNSYGWDVPLPEHPIHVPERMSCHPSFFMRAFRTRKNSIVLVGEQYAPAKTL